MSDSPSSHPLEALVEQVGGSNCFQAKMFAVIVVKWLLASMLQFSPNLLFQTADFTCLNNENGDQGCSQWVCSQDPAAWRQHLTEVPSTLSYEFQWYLCDRAWVVSVVQSMIYLGTLVGYVCVPFFADNFGRLRTERVVWGIAAIGAFMLAFAWNIYAVGVGLFLCGAGVNSALTLHYCFINQLVSPRTKSKMIVGLQITYSTGVCLIALLSKYIVNWRELALYCLAIPMVTILAGNALLQETPEFSLEKGAEILHESLNRIAAVNGKQHLSLEHITEAVREYHRPAERLSAISLFRYKSIRLMAYCCTCIDIAMDFSYDGVLYSLNEVGFSLSTNQMAMAMSEIVASGICGFLVPRFKRKRTMITLLSLITFLLLAVVGLSHLQFSDSVTKALTELSLFILLRFMMSSAWAFYSVYLTQLFPGEVTSIAICFFHSVGTLAASFSPYIRLIGKNKSLSVMALLAGLAAGHVGCLPETKGNPHRQRITERGNSMRQEQSFSMVAIEKEVL